MKKIFVLFSSPHKNGKTKKLLSSFVKPLEKQFNIEIFNTYDNIISPCIDCKKCIKSGFCNFNDLETLSINLESCDIIIIASPIYNFGFPSPLKSVLDRFQLYYNFYIENNRCKIEKSKEIVLLLTCGRPEDNATIHNLEKQVNCIFKYLNAKIIYKIIWDNTDANSDLNEDLLQKIERVSDFLIDKN